MGVPLSLGSGGASIGYTFCIWTHDEDRLTTFIALQRSINFISEDSRMETRLLGVIVGNPWNVMPPEQRRESVGKVGLTFDDSVDIHTCRKKY